MSDKPKKVNVFISYSHDDIDYLNKLKVYLHEKTCPLLNVWEDGKINPGMKWDETIKKHLTDSHIILLLISQNFLISDYIEKIELATALEKQKQNKIKVIPIFTRTCDLKKDSPIAALQGLPKDMRFLSSMGNEIDDELTEIQKEINDIAAALWTEEHFKHAQARNDEKGKRANMIEDLRNKKKIFLSLPETSEAKKKRDELIIQADGKRNYEDWPYELVPGIKTSKEIEKMSEDERTTTLCSLLNESLYSIHIVEADDDLKKGSNKIQYDLAKGRHALSTTPVYRSIVWLLNTDLKNRMENEFCMNPIVTGHDYGELFAKIASLEIEKEKEIKEGMKEFFPSKKVYMYYDWKDHDNDLRITLKTKIEEKNFCVRCNTPGEKSQKQKEELEACEGALIFYGAAEPKWYVVGQANILGVKNLRSRSVCLDEPEIEKKEKRDVSRKDFITIRGKENLDAGLNIFWTNLYNHI